MTPDALQEWSVKNNAYLAAGLEWLRLRLRRMAALHPPAPNSAIEPSCLPQPFTLREFLFGRDHKEQPSAQPRNSSPPEDLTEAIAAAHAHMQQASTMDPPPALLMLTSRFGLSEFETHLLLLCVAMELDSDMGTLCALAQGSPTLRAPTFSLALMLFDNAAWDVLSPERPLRFWRFIEISQGAGQPLTGSVLRADERIVNCAKGLNYVDDRFAALLTVVEPSSASLPPSHDVLARTIVESARRPASLPLMHLLGPDPTGKLFIAQHVCSLLNLALMKLSADLLPANPVEIENLARLWQRECTLLPLALFLDAHDAEKELATVNRFLGRTGGIAFLATREAIPGFTREAVTFDVARPTGHEQRDTWREILGRSRDADADALASQFHLGTHEILRVARLCSGESGTPDRGRLWNACLSAARPRLDTLAQRIEPKANWDTLVIAEPERTLLHQIAGQVRSRMRVYGDWGFARMMNRGLGISALFSGESGTGKTMAAEVIANDLDLNLYRIDLSAVVSKYIGETEKNLRRVFDAAEDGGAILFFDEADALFGKRSEVKDSHDRYANIEINYLLQRMEAYAASLFLPPT